MNCLGPVPTTGSWLTCWKRNPGAHVRLFCLPYAGGGASLFKAWPDLLPSNVEICAIQLPGRETRFGERPFTRLPPLIQTLARVLRLHLDRPFAIFGHSMGGLIGFELARQLRRQREPGPVRLFVSAHRAPQLPNPDQPIHELLDSALLMQLRILYGAPQSVVNDPELIQLYLPLLRADLELCESYAYSTEDPLDCPITAFGGTEDCKVSRAELSAWRIQTRSSFHLRAFTGNHFFLETALASVLGVVVQDLKQALKRQIHG